MMRGLMFLHLLQKKNHHLSSQDLLHLISSPLCIIAVPCAFTHALSHRCHEGLSSHDPHREQGMLELIMACQLPDTCLRCDSCGEMDMFEKQCSAVIACHHSKNSSREHGKSVAYLHLPASLPLHALVAHKSSPSQGGHQRWPRPQ